MPSSDSSSSSSSSSSSDSSSTSDRASKKRKHSSSSDHERKHKHHKKDAKKHKHKSKHKHHKKDAKKHKHKSKHKHKHKSKHKSEDEAQPTLNLSAQFGKYGIIRMEDLYNKTEEFYLWAREVKKSEPEEMQPRDLKEAFKSYMEDYNTGTFPSMKYYDVAKFEHEQAAKRRKKGGSGAVKQDGGGVVRSVFNDEDDRRREQQRDRENKRRIEELGTLAMMKKDSQMVADMQHQDQLRRQAEVLYKTGDRDGAGDIMKRIDPSLEDEEKKLRDERIEMKKLSRS